MVIVNFNTGRLLTDAVHAALCQVSILECIVVDNASSDSSIGCLRDSICDCRLMIMEMDSNIGFAAGCNQGILRSRGAFVLVLNPDCVLAEGALQPMLDALSASDEVAAAGPLILNMDGTEQRGCRRSIPTPWQIFCVGIGLHRLMPNHPRFRGFNRVGEALPAGPTPIPSVSGACMLIRRDAIDRVGRFDERYFLHFEDLDWCLRAGEAGLRIIFVPAAVAHHVGGVSGRNRPIQVEAHKHTSLIRFVQSNFAQYYPSAFIVFVSMIVYVRWLAVAGRILVMGRSERRAGWNSLFFEADDRSSTRTPVRRRADLSGDRL